MLAVCRHIILGPCNHLVNGYTEKETWRRMCQKIQLVLLSISPCVLECPPPPKRTVGDWFPKENVTAWLSGFGNDLSAVGGWKTIWMTGDGPSPFPVQGLRRHVQEPAARMDQRVPRPQLYPHRANLLRCAPRGPALWLTTGSSAVHGLRGLSHIVPRL